LFRALNAVMLLEAVGRGSRRYFSTLNIHNRCRRADPPALSAPQRTYFNGKGGGVYLV